MAVTTQPYTGTFVADPNHSSFLFAIGHMKVSSFRATFDDVEARLVADDSQPALEGRARVESISITDPPEFREHVVNGEDFFDARRHPEILFRSDRIELDEDGSAQVEGVLEIKGIAVPVTATGSHRPPIEDPYGTARAAIELTATVDRRQWGMDWQMPLPDGDDVLGNEVELTVQLELVAEQD